MKSGAMVGRAQKAGIIHVPKSQPSRLSATPSQPLATFATNQTNGPPVLHTPVHRYLCVSHPIVDSSKRGDRTHGNHIPEIIKSTLPSDKNSNLSAGDCTNVMRSFAEPESESDEDDAKARRAALTIPALGSTPWIFLNGVSSTVA